MTDKYKIITLIGGEKHLAEFNHRRNRWIAVGNQFEYPPEYIVKIEEAVQ